MKKRKRVDSPEEEELTNKNKAALNEAFINERIEQWFIFYFKNNM